MDHDEKKSVNVLSLDGGGVRGLSTLIILRTLLCLINRKLNPMSHNGEPIHPREVFDLIVGTSTGGLIALMMVKFDMGVDECIFKYKELSQKIFKQWHVLGYMSGGFGAVTKFSSKNLRNVLIENVIQPGLEARGIRPEDYMMEQIDSHPNIMCSVVCNELYKETRERNPDATVFICSHWNNTDSDSPLICKQGCRKSNQDKVPVIDAARATSAAPTFFKHVELLDSLLVDGGFGNTNNPSHAAYTHYFWPRLSEFDYIRMVNIGTGSMPKEYKPKKSWVHYLPYFGSAASVLSSLAKIATDSEEKGDIMRTLAGVSQGLGSGVLRFDRFSADRGDIHLINLYEHGAISKLEDITNEYLRDEGVIKRLEDFAEELALTCRARRARAAAPREHHIVLSEVSETGTGTQVTPQIILESVHNEAQLVELHHDQEPQPAPGTPPELVVDASSRGSFDSPTTPEESTKHGRDKLLATVMDKLLGRPRQNVADTPAPGPATIS